jgi:hypothetical protein
MPKRHFRRWMIAVAAPLALCGLAQLPAAAQPRVHQTRPKADSTGPIVVDSHGTGYLAWDGKTSGTNGDAIVFCKIPRGARCTKPKVLPLPAGAHWDNYDVIQPFPVLGGKSGTVLIVGPSYDFGDVVVWASTDGGARFGLPQVIPSPSYADTTAVDDVLRAPNNATANQNYFAIAGHNTGLGYTYTGTGAIGAMAPPYGFKQRTDGVAGAVSDGTLGFSGKQAVEAFSTDAGVPRVYYFWTPQSGVSGSPGTLEHGPIEVSKGSNPRLAGGKKGLFILTEDAGSTPSKPLRLRVRKWNHATHKFGAPTYVGKVRNDVNSPNIGGFTEDVSNGTLVVAWPGYGTHGGYLMRVWTSTNGGQSFVGPRTVSPIGFAYSGPARVAATGADGFLTFEERAGLVVVDLNHL